MTVNENFIIKNGLSNRVVYFLSLFVMIPIGIYLLDETLNSGLGLAILYFLPIPEPFSSIILIALSLGAIFLYPIYVFHVEALKITIDNKGIYVRTLLSILKGTVNVIEWTGINKIVPVHEKGKLNQLQFFLANDAYHYIDTENLSENDKEKIVNLINNYLPEYSW